MPNQNRRGLDRIAGQIQPYTREFLAAMRYSVLLVFSTALFAVPGAAQLGSPEEASGMSGVDILQSIIYFLMFVVPMIAVIIILIAFAVLMTTRNPQKKTDWKKTRNQAALYGLMIVPAFGVLLEIIGILTGHPVLTDLAI